MFEELFERPHTIAKYQSAPLYEDRARYLTHVAATGARHRTLYRIANYQLKLVRLVDLWEGETVTVSRITAVAEAWSHSEGYSGSQRARSAARRDFLGHALRWLRFLGRVEEPAQPCHPHAAEVDADSGEADHRFRCEADHPVRSSRSPIGAKRRGGSIMPFSDRLGSIELSSFASILLST